MTTCIVTDTTAQFPARLFPGQDHVRVVTIEADFNEDPENESERVKTSHFPQTLEKGKDGVYTPKLLIPDVAELQNLFSSLANRYDQIVGIFL